MDALIIFVAQFSIVYLMGIQSLNIKGGHYVGAAVTSLLMGVAAFYCTSIVGKMSLDDLLSIVGVGFITAGPVGITLAMLSHKRLVKLFSIGLYGGIK